jgi:hypothetical protein
VEEDAGREAAVVGAAGNGGESADNGELLVHGVLFKLTGVY